MIHRSHALYQAFLLASITTLSAAACGDDDTDPFCGDGIVQYSDGEMCDDGSDNGSNGRCSLECRFNPGYCVFDQETACTENRCGEFIAYDSCGLMALASCGECGEAGTVCIDNFCIPEEECSLAAEVQTALCEGRCGALEAEDACGRSIALDCGSSCKDGLECNEETGLCFDPSDCVLPEDTASLCTSSLCGGLAVLDSCGAEKIIDCSGTEGAFLADPLKDLTEDGGVYSCGLSVPWDETGDYRAAVHREGNAALYLLFKSTLSEGQSGSLGAVGIDDDGNIGTCGEDFCAFVEKRNEDGTLEYWYDSVSGTASLQKLSPLSVEISEAQFKDAAPSQSAECITPKVSFSYVYSGACTTEDIAALNGEKIGGGTEGRGFQTARTYRVSGEIYRYDQVAFYQHSPAFFLYAEINDFQSPSHSPEDEAESSPDSGYSSPKFAPGSSIALDTIGGIDGEGHPYCESEACVILLTDHEYHASEGTLTLISRDAEAGILAGEITDAVFYMADADDVSPRECLSTAVSFSFETAAGMCEMNQADAVPCFSSFEEDFDWTVLCTKATAVSEPGDLLGGTARRIAEEDEEGWNEIEYLSSELNSSGSAILINVNDYYGQALPFSLGRLSPFESYNFHPLSSQWEVTGGSAYCLSPVCVGYIGGTQLYAPARGTISVTSVEGTFSGSVADAVFSAVEEGESGEVIDCVFSPISFSFSVPIDGDGSGEGSDSPDAGSDPELEDGEDGGLTQPDASENDDAGAGADSGSDADAGSGDAGGE